MSHSEVVGGVWHLTPIDRRVLSPNELFTPPDTDRYGFDLKSSVFDERSFITNKGYIPSFSIKSTNYNFRKEDTGYDLDSIFSEAHHESIRHIINLNSGMAPYSDYAYGDISLDIIEKSLTPELRDAIKVLKTTDGRSARVDYLKAIQSLLIRDELKYFNSTYITNLARFQKEKEGDSYKLRSKTKDQNQAVKTLLDSSVPVDPSCAMAE